MELVLLHAVDQGVELIGAQAAALVADIEAGYRPRECYHVANYCNDQFCFGSDVAIDCKYDPIHQWSV